jgi:hypothetical protein
MEDDVNVFQQRTLALSALQRPEMGAGDRLLKVEYSSASTGTESLLWKGATPALLSMGDALVPGFCYRSVGVSSLQY